MKRGMLLAGLGVALSLCGCGYKAGGPYRDDVRTVYVDMFGSREFRRDLEFTLTEAVKKRIGSDTPYRLAGRENADTILSGEVIEQPVSAFAPDFQTQQPREKQVTLAVRLYWKDQRTGRVLVDEPIVLEAVDYLPPMGETEEFARDRVTDRMARKIVAKLYEDW